MKTHSKSLIIIYSILGAEFLHRVLVQKGLNQMIVFLIGGSVGALWIHRKYFLGMVLSALGLILSLTSLKIPVTWIKLMDLISFPKKTVLYQSLAFQDSPYWYQGPTLGLAGTMGLILLLWDLRSKPISANHGLAIGMIILFSPTGFAVPAPLIMGALAVLARHRLMSLVVRIHETIADRAI